MQRHTWTRLSPAAFSAHAGSLPMFRVTVMMLRDMVESVTLLKDDVWKTGGGGERGRCRTRPPTFPPHSFRPAPAQRDPS